MKIQLDILKNSKPLVIQYVSSVFNESDTDTEIYDTCKLSVFLTDGLVAIVNNKLIGGEKGDILLFNPREIHFGRFIRQGNHRFLEIYFPYSFFESFCNCGDLTYVFDDASPERINCIKGSVNERIEIMEMAERIVSLISEGAPENNMEIYACILRLLTMSTKLYEKSKNAKVDDAVTPSYVIRCIEYISEHYSEKIKVEDVASMLGCSVAYLSRLFKKYVGMSLYDYIVEYRINIAKAILKTDCSVTEACYLSGFGDCSNFIGKFKKITGVTPLQYKKIVQSF